MQPRPHRYAKRCGRGFGVIVQAPLQICSSESSLKLFLSESGFQLRTTCLVVLQCYWQSSTRLRVLCWRDTERVVCVDQALNRHKGHHHDISARRYRTWLEQAGVRDAGFEPATSCV